MYTVLICDKSRNRKWGGVFFFLIHLFFRGRNYLHYHETQEIALLQSKTPCSSRV